MARTVTVCGITFRPATDADRAAHAEQTRKTMIRTMEAMQRNADLWGIDFNACVAEAKRKHEEAQHHG